MVSMDSQNLPIALPEESQAVCIWDRNNPRSIANLLPPNYAEILSKGWLTRPDLHGLNDRELWKKLRAEGKTPNPHDNRMRYKFWVEYDDAQNECRKMQISRIIAGVTTIDHFLSYYLTIPEKCVWMLTMPAEYDAVAKEALSFGMERLRDMLEMDTHDSKGRPNVKLMELQAKIVGMLDIRVKGAITQRIEQKTLSVHVGSPDPHAQKSIAHASMDELKERLKNLRARELQNRVKTLVDPNKEPGV